MRLFSNRMLVDLLCLNETSEFIGQNPLDYIHEEHRSLVLENQDKSEDVDKVTQRFKIKSKNATPVNVFVTSSNIEWSNKSAQLHILQNIDEMMKHRVKFDSIEIGLKELENDIKSLGSLEPAILKNILGKIDQIKKFM